MIYLFLVALLIIYALIFRSIYERNVIDITTVNILHPLIKKKDTTFVYFSDLHGVSFGLNNCKLIEKINEINPDAIIIGGDMIIDKSKHFLGASKEKETAIDLLNELSLKYPIFYGMGNHETKLKLSPTLHSDFNSYLYRIKNKNMHILSNEHEYVTLNGNRFCIYGLEIAKEYYGKKKIKNADIDHIKACLSESPEHKHSIPIVISHNPDSFDAVAKWGAEYVLSGHNHGGFVRLPLLGGVIGSNFRLFPKYYAGIYKHNTENSTMLLSRGLGNHTIKFRINNKPELMVISFKSKGDYLCD